MKEQISVAIQNYVDEKPIRGVAYVSVAAIVVENFIRWVL